MVGVARATGSRCAAAPYSSGEHRLAKIVGPMMIGG